MLADLAVQTGYRFSFVSGKEGGDRFLSPPPPKNVREFFLKKQNTNLFVMQMSHKSADGERPFKIFFSANADVQVLRET